MTFAVITFLAAMPRNSFLFWNKNNIIGITITALSLYTIVTFCNYWLSPMFIVSTIYTITSFTMLVSTIHRFSVIKSSMVHISYTNMLWRIHYGCIHCLKMQSPILDNPVHSENAQIDHSQDAECTVSHSHNCKTYRNLEAVEQHNQLIE